MPPAADDPLSSPLAPAATAPAPAPAATTTAAPKPSDPTALVAYTTYLYRCHSTNHSARAADAAIWERGPAKHRDGTIDPRTAPVLDALACIAVHSPRSEVIAVGLQLTLPDIRLFVAGNDPVPDSLVVYYRTVWTQLRTLLDEYAEGRPASSDKRGPSPTRIPTAATLALEQNLVRTIVRHTRPKLQKRLSKWCRILEDFAHAYTRWKEGMPNHVEPAQQRLDDLAAVIGALTGCTARLATLDRWDSNTLEWETWVNVMNLATDRALGLLGDVHLLELWATRAEEAAGKGPQSFRLYRALEKTTSLNRHIQTLIRFTASSRLRHLFTPAANFDVVPVPPAHVTLPGLTAEPAYWEAFHISLFDQYDLDLQSSAVITPKLAPGPLRPHCECSLITYLSSCRDTVVFSYLGVSKLSCRPCTLWINAYNAAHPLTRYSVKGSHNKWYWRWGVPRLASDEKQDVVVRRFAHSVGKLAQKKLMKTGIARARAKTDSTDSSDRDFLMLKEQEEKAKQALEVWGGQPVL